ncbi:hypothetical protein HNY73_022547 [Argiope bruennichi]|uniref:Uncharacterized protein n=1 Tax=Argiope bruennichi TaxID=94029 RepID=A0A8T0E3L0_ARGBR|nr:hypothetical protein HNY73_022547 [Argiope bruennichi]
MRWACEDVLKCGKNHKNQRVAHITHKQKSQMQSTAAIRVTSPHGEDAKVPQDVSPLPRTSPFTFNSNYTTIDPLRLQLYQHQTQAPWSNSLINFHISPTTTDGVPHCSPSEIPQDDHISEGNG